MSISRSQIPSQIDAFATGGDISESVISPSFSLDNLNELSRLLREGSQLNYDANVEKYKGRLKDVVQPARKMNIYDVASDLGAGILSTPNVGGISFAQGLGAGFTRVSDRMRMREEEKRKTDQQIAMQAVQMAQQDEQKALDFLREMDYKAMEMKNKPADYITFAKQNEDGTVQYKTLKNDASNNPEIDNLLAEGFYEQKGGGTNIRVGDDKEDFRSKKAVDKQYAQEEEISERATGARASLAAVDEALAIANRLGQVNFGAVEKLTMYPRELLAALGFADRDQLEILADQKLLSQISMGFTMDIVSRTKGAISNREMELFISASPGLGSTYEGFIKQAEYLRRIAQRDVDFFNAYTQKAKELEAKELKGEMTASEVYRNLEAFEGDWYDRTYYDAETQSFITGDERRKSNFIFSEEETKQLRKVRDSGVRDKDTGEIAFKLEDANEFINEYTQKQNTPNPSNYDPRISEANRLIAEIQNSTMTQEEKDKEIQAIRRSVGLL